MKVRLFANGSRPWERWIRRWGLSFLIDDDILFDAFGDARVLMGNLRRFNVDIEKIRCVVISHEHWCIARFSQRYPGIIPDVGGLKSAIYRGYLI